MIDTLVTFGTLQYAHRQYILGTSAIKAGVVRRHIPFTPARLNQTDFAKRFPSVRLYERGAGFWAWKPFIIRAALDNVKLGDSVLYCDVGRTFPIKALDVRLDPLLDWMEQYRQAVLPGVSIPWHGPMSRWTKRDAFALTGCDSSIYSESPQIQASFSIWKRAPAAECILSQWMEWCTDRRLVSDDSNTCGLPELPDFKEHRHDQSLLSLLCIRESIRPLYLGPNPPSFDEKNPSAIAHSMGVSREKLPLSLRCLISSMEALERAVRPQACRR